MYRIKKGIDQTAELNGRVEGWNSSSKSEIKYLF